MKAAKASVSPHTGRSTGGQWSSSAWRSLANRLAEDESCEVNEVGGVEDGRVFGSDTREAVFQSFFGSGSSV